MAKFNEILEARFNRALTKVFSMKGPAPSPQVSGEIFGSIPFFWGSEARWLEEWQRFGTFQSIGAGGAGNISVLQWVNPVGSKIVAVIEKVLVTANAPASPQRYTWHFQPDQAFANLVNTNIVPQNSFFDNRRKVGSNLVFTSKNNSNAAASGNNLVSIIVSPNTSWDMIATDIQEVVMLPGSTMALDTTTANQEMDASIFWRERALTESELV